MRTVEHNGRVYEKRGGIWTHRFVGVSEELAAELERLASDEAESVSERLLQRLEAEGIPFLYHITDERNLGSIRDLGLLSRRRIEDRGIHFEDIADPDVLERRDSLAFFVPLYLAEETPMSKLAQQSSPLKLLRINLRVLQLPGVMVAPGNAAVEGVVPDSDPEVVDRIDWRAIRERYRPRHRFGSYDDWREWKARRMAEVLVRDRIPPELIDR